MGAAPDKPLTLEELAAPAELEPGREVHFCPIQGLPIRRSQRVRALPGFHLLSLEAGKEAVARGYYDAFGQRFACVHLEHLHPDDKVFVCAEDHKAFLNQMSMQYHRYIRHELEERKAERKRMRARAEERKIRAEKAKQQAQAQAQAAPRAPAAPAAAPAAPSRPSALRHTTQPAAAAAAPEAAAGSKPKKQKKEQPTAPLTPAAALAPPTPGTEAAAAPPKPKKQKKAEQASTPAAAPPAVPAPPPAPAEPPRLAVASDPYSLPEEADLLMGLLGSSGADASAAARSEDIYGGLEQSEAKKGKGSDQDYATAIGAMLEGGFDDDE